MKQLLLNPLSLSGICMLLASNVTAATSSRIGIDDEYITKIYALGVNDANLGVYTLNSVSDTPSKISTGTYIQYSFNGSGGTFVSESKLYGTAYKYGSTYGVIATAEGTEDGPWYHTFYNYRTPDYVTIPATSVAKDMTFNPVDEKIYGIFKKGAYSTDYCLATYDGENFTTTQIGDLPAFTVLDAIACDAQGTLYAINGTKGKLVTIDKSNAAVTEVGSLGVIATGKHQSAAIDATTGKMYWISTASMYSTTQVLYEVDLTTGAATKLYDVTSGVYNGLYIAAPKSAKGAPAEVEGLAAEFTGEGHNMKINFTLPTKNFGGGVLTGEIEYIIYSDNEEVARGNGNPGDAVEKICELEDGFRKISVECVKGEMVGPRVSITVFAGFDKPTNISNLTLTNEDKKVTLHWDAPIGVNGGILNQEALSYSVVRNPGAVEVASGLKDCEFTDEIPDGPVAIYQWTVKVDYEGADDLSANTGTLLFGEPLEVPYSQNFDALETLSEGVIGVYNDDSDNINESPTWILSSDEENKFVSIESQYYVTHKDYMFTAPIKFLKGVKYTLKFKLATSAVSPVIYDWSTNPPTEVPRPYILSVYLTNGHSVAEDDKVTPALTEDIQFTCTDQEQVGQFTEQTMTFTVAEDAVYSICFLEKSEWYLSNISLRLDDIEVTAEYPTPAAVENLTTEASEEYNRDINISFTLPKVDTNGEELSSLSRVEIYRGSNLIATLTEDLMPGSEIQYVDKDSPRGINSYKVVPFAYDNAGSASFSSVKSGYVNNLKIVNYSFPETIPVDDTADAQVKIVNDAFEIALDYRVVLLIDGEERFSTPGTALAPDEEKVYNLYLPWQADMPETVKMQFYIEFFGDEYTDDNYSEEQTVKFEPKQVSLDAIDSEEVILKVADCTLYINHAAGMPIAVYTTTGNLIATSNNHSESYNISLDKGLYLVSVGTHTYKVNL